MLDEQNFSKQKRLLSPLDYQRVHQQAKRFTDNNITVFTRPNNNSTARIGFGFSAKKVKSAVNRNTLKRIGRESFRLALADLPRVDVVVIAKIKITQVDKRALRKEFDRLWQKLHKQYGGS